MLDGLEDEDKWRTTQTSGAWVVYFFGKPIVMKGYGLRSCRKTEKTIDMDPKSFNLAIIDAVKKDDKEDGDETYGQNNWDKVSVIKNKKFNSPLEVMEF